MTSVALVRRIKASPAILFEAFTSVEGLTNWWGPDDRRVLFAEADIRVGGAFRVRFETRDGLQHECAGEFLEVVRPERIAMSWRWTSGGEPLEGEAVSRVELHLKPIELGTELTLIHAALADEGSRRSHEAGWSGALDKLVRTFDQT